MSSEQVQGNNKQMFVVNKPIPCIGESYTDHILIQLVGISRVVFSKVQGLPLKGAHTVPWNNSPLTRNPAEELYIEPRIF